jgi:hypothetical protein
MLFTFAILGLVSCSDQQQDGFSDVKVRTSSVKLTDFSAPKGNVVLKISGDFSQKNTADELWLDSAQIEKLPQIIVNTTTQWTKGESEFKGPLIRDLLSAIGSKASLISATAINEYKNDIPIADINKFNVILAMQKDGEVLSIREKGPLWIIYPWSSHEGLKNDRYYSRSIWQLVKINLHD